jgi:hypothetical protein
MKNVYIRSHIKFQFKKRMVKTKIHSPKFGTPNKLREEKELLALDIQELLSSGLHELKAQGKEIVMP